MDPAYPSTPPPPPDESVRPMSYFGAALWITGIHFTFEFLVGALLVVGAAQDLVARLCCQLIAYIFGLFLLLRLHGPHMRIRDFVGLRRTHPALFGLSAMAGAAVAIPATALLGAIERRWPAPETSFDFVETFFRAGNAERALMAAGVVVLGPFVEEVLFRGAIFGPLRARKDAAPVILVTAAYFALVHQEPRRLVPIFLVGLLLGYVRAASGSLWPAALLHMSFNAVPFVSILTQGEQAGDEAESAIPPSLLFGSIGACLLLVLVIFLVAQKSRLASAARRADAAGVRLD